MATALLKEAAVRENAIYALPGSPSVLEDTTRMLLIRGVEAGVEIKIVQGVSFIEPTLAAVNFDFSKGLQIVLPGLHLRNGNFSARLAMLVCQVGPEQLDDIVQWLLKTYPRDHQVTLIWTAGLPTYETEHKAVALADLGREFGEGKYFASLLVPPVSGDGARYGRLAAPTKCLDRDDQIRDVLRRDVAAPNPADRCGSMLLGASIYSVKKFSRAPNFPIGPLRIFLSDPDNQFRRWVIMPDRPSAAS